MPIGVAKDVLLSCLSFEYTAGKCHDIYAECAELTAKDPQYCSTDDALRGCHKTCNFCGRGHEKLGNVTITLFSVLMCYALCITLEYPFVVHQLCIGHEDDAWMQYW